MTKRAEVIIKQNGVEIDAFYSKTLTKRLNKLAPGTEVQIFIKEKGFGEQFVGNLIVKGLADEPEDPTPSCAPGMHWDDVAGKCVPDIQDCPQGQHFDEALGRCVDDVVTPPDHTCPAGQHWDDAQGKCVDDVVTPPSTGLLWSSNIHGKWNDGNKREITTKQGGQTTDDKSIFVAASGSPKLIIDGNGVAHLQAGSGGVENLSLKGLCSHQGNMSPLAQDGPAEGSKRGGGEGFAVGRKDWDSKRERFHNEHQSLGSGSLPKEIVDLKWHVAKFSWKHESGNKIRLIGSIDYLDGKGFVQVMNLVDSNAEAWFFEKDGNKYIWIRINNSAHGRIYIMAYNYDAELTVPFMFEPATNSIALKDVELVAI